MRRTLLVAVPLLGLAAVVAYAAWAFQAAPDLEPGWRGLRSAWPYLLAGVLTVACVIGAFVWLAFFSERRGYDDRASPPNR